METKNQINKRRNSYLMMETKIKIINDFSKGQKISQLAKEYNVHRSSISRIIKNKDVIIQQYNIICKMGGNVKRKRFSGCEDSPFETALIYWFNEKRSSGESITGPLLKQKALDVHREINGETSFSASDGWLSRFKERHGLRCLDIKGNEEKEEKGNDNATLKYELNIFLQEHGYDPDNIYSANETSLSYASLPEKIIDASNKKELLNKNQMKRCVTLLVCANVTGTHKIPLLVIGNSSESHFKNVHLPVEYRTQENACMNTTIFLDWYKHIFIPLIKARKPKDYERFMLLLNNKSLHPSTEEFDAVDMQCKVFHFPPSVTSYLQPMNQGVISTLKRNYKEIFLCELLNQNIADFSGFSNFISDWSILNCCDTLLIAWENISKETIKNAWKIIIDMPGEIIIKNEQKSIVHLMNKILDDITFSEKDSDDWINDDIHFCFKGLGDKEIINHYDIIKVETLNDETLEGNFDPPIVQKLHVPTISSIIEAFTTISNWCKMRDKNEISSEDYLTLLRIRQRAINIKLNEKAVEN